MYYRDYSVKKYAKGGMINLSKYYKTLPNKDLLVGLKVYDKINEEYVYIKDVDSGIRAGKNKNDEFGHNYSMSDLMIEEMAHGGLMANGGEINEEEGVDLFSDNDGNDIPPQVQKILDKYEERLIDGMDYKEFVPLHDELYEIGYTFELGLSGEPYDLRKIGQRGKSEFYAKGGGVGEPYDSMTKYQIEKEYKKLNEKRDLLKKKYGTFQSDEVAENEKEIDKIITLLYGENFSGKGQKFKYEKGGMMADGGMMAKGGLTSNIYYEIRDENDRLVKSYLSSDELIKWAKEYSKELNENVKIENVKQAIKYIEKYQQNPKYKYFEIYTRDNSGMMAKGGKMTNSGISADIGRMYKGDRKKIKFIYVIHKRDEYGDIIPKPVKKMSVVRVNEETAKEVVYKKYPSRNYFVELEDAFYVK